MKYIKSFFKNTKNLDHALTHRSWVNENRGKRTSNERLEFLGDAILEFIVSQAIFARLPDKEEGYLTALRANIVNTKNLALVAEKLKLGKLILLSKGEEEGRGRENASLLADTMEAIIGAIFLDSGLKKATTFVEENLLSDLEEKLKQPLKDAKSRLQEKVQANGFPAPKYKVVKQVGPDHDKKFTLDVVVDGKSIGTGKGKNKSEAAQKAAEDALESYK